MSNLAKKSRNARTVPTEVVSARLQKPKLSVLRKLYPGRSNQAILESLVEERLARKDFGTWLDDLEEAQKSGALDLERV